MPKTYLCMISTLSEGVTVRSYRLPPPPPPRLPPPELPPELRLPPLEPPEENPPPERDEDAAELRLPP